MPSELAMRIAAKLQQFWNFKADADEFSCEVDIIDAEIAPLLAEKERLTEALNVSEALRRQQVAELEQQVAALRADAERIK